MQELHGCGDDHGGDVADRAYRRCVYWSTSIGDSFYIIVPQNMLLYIFLTTYRDESAVV